MPYKEETAKKFTMIRIEKKTLKKLRKMKAHPNQSDSEIISILLKEREEKKS